MKRSEMVKSMDEKFGGRVDGYGTTQSSAEDILDFLEKAGMLPPTVCWLATGEYSPVKELTELATSDYDCSIQWEEE